MADRFDVGKIDAAQVAPDEVEGSAKEAALGCDVKLQERARFEEDGFTFLAEVGGSETFEFGGPVVFFGAGPLGRAAEGGGQ